MLFRTFRAAHLGKKHLDLRRECRAKTSILNPSFYFSFPMFSIYKAVNFVKFEKNLDVTFFSRDLTKPNFKVKD